MDVYVYVPRPIYGSVPSAPLLGACPCAKTVPHCVGLVPWLSAWPLHCRGLRLRAGTDYTAMDPSDDGAHIQHQSSSGGGAAPPISTPRPLCTYHVCTQPLNLPLPQPLPPAEPTQTAPTQQEHTQATQAITDGGNDNPFYPTEATLPQPLPGSDN